MTVRDLIRRRLGAAAVFAISAAAATAADPPPLLDPPPLIPAAGTAPAEPKKEEPKAEEKKPDEAKKEEPKKDEAKPAVPPPLVPPPLVPPAADSKPTAPAVPPPSVPTPTPPAVPTPAPPAVPAPPAAGGLPPLVLPPLGAEPAKPAEAKKDEPKPVAVPKPVDVSPIVPAVPAAPVVPVVVPPKVEAPPAVKPDMVVAKPDAPAKPDMVVPKIDVVPMTPIAPATKPVEAVPASRMQPATEVRPTRPMADPPARPATPPPAAPPATPAGVGRPTSRSADGLAAFHLMIAEAKVAYSKVRDYSGHLIRQDRVRGMLQPEQTAEVRAKTQPASLYLRWIAPAGAVGREAAYTAGKNAGRVRIKPAGSYGPSAWTTVEPADPKGMADGRVPLPMVGVGPIVARLERLARVEAQLRNPVFVSVGDYTYAGKPVVRYEAVLEQPHALREAYRVVVYIDPETKLPVRWECYDQPTAGGDPAGDLLECCSFVNLKYNQGLPDSLFDR